MGWCLSRKVERKLVLLLSTVGALRYSFSLLLQGLSLKKMIEHTIHNNVHYNDNTEPRQSLDLYLPTTSTSNDPLIVFIHGKLTLF